jgi:hypothetical protein
MCANPRCCCWCAGHQGTEPKAFFSVDEGHSVESLAAYSKGFVAGLDGGLVALFDKDEREYYRRTRTFTVMEHPLPVRSAAAVSAHSELWKHCPAAADCRQHQHSSCMTVHVSWQSLRWVHSGTCKQPCMLLGACHETFWLDLPCVSHAFPAGLQEHRHLIQ